MPPLNEHAGGPGGIGVERRLQAAVPAVPGEGSTGSAVEALRIRARTSGAMARAMPVIDYFYTQLGPGRFEIASDVRILDDAILSRTVIEPLSVGAVVPDPTWIAFVLPLCPGPRRLGRTRSPFRPACPATGCRPLAAERAAAATLPM